MILPDLLSRDLTTVFCGSAVGAASAKLGAPYAGPGNKFWPMLAETRLTPRRFEPGEWHGLLALGIGITDINKTESGADGVLSPDCDDPSALLAKIEVYRPRQVAFTAKRPAGVFMRRVFARRTLEYGLQSERIGDTALYVLPSPSGLAVRYWDTSWWHRLADLHRAYGRPLVG